MTWRVRRNSVFGYYCDLRGRQPVFKMMFCTSSPHNLYTSESLVYRTGLRNHLTAANPSSLTGGFCLPPPNMTLWPAFALPNYGSGQESRDPRIWLGRVALAPLTHRPKSQVKRIGTSSTSSKELPPSNADVVHLLFHIACELTTASFVFPLLSVNAFQVSLLAREPSS